MSLPLAWSLAILRAPRALHPRISRISLWQVSDLSSMALSSLFLSEQHTPRIDHQHEIIVCHLKQIASCDSSFFGWKASLLPAYMCVTPAPLTCVELMGWLVTRLLSVRACWPCWPLAPPRVHRMSATPLALSPVSSPVLYADRAPCGALGAAASTAATSCAAANRTASCSAIRCAEHTSRAAASRATASRATASRAATCCAASCAAASCAAASRTAASRTATPAAVPPVTCVGVHHAVIIRVRCAAYALHAPNVPRWFVLRPNVVVGDT